MSTTTIKLYRVFCIQEGINVDVWAVDPPEICPNDHNDRTIDSSRTRVINFLSENKVMIEEALQGFYQASSIRIDIPSGTAGDVTTHDYSYPMDLSILQIGFNTKNDMIDDEISFLAEPETLIGQITQDANIGDTVLNVPQQTAELPNLVKGMEIVIENSSNSPTKEDLGRITAIDPVNFTIIVEVAPSQLFAAGSNLLINTYVLRNFIIQKGDGQEYMFGQKGIGARETPANTLNRIIYRNNNGLAKTFYIFFEYYYL